MGASFEEHLLSVKMACGSFGNVCKVIGLLLFVSLFPCFPSVVYQCSRVQNGRKRACSYFMRAKNCRCYDLTPSIVLKQGKKEEGVIRY